VFTAGDAVVTATVIGALITGALPPGSSTAAVVQLMLVGVLALQFQPVPLGVAVVVIPAGSGSLIVIAPLVLVVPLLLTTIEYVPLCPTANAAGVAVFAIDSCCVPPLLSVSVALLLPALGSVTPAGAVTVAVFEIFPVAARLIVAFNV
jgi:hypothetical protein